MPTLFHPTVNLLPDVAEGGQLQSPVEFRSPIFDELRYELAAYLDLPGDAERWDRLCVTRRAACAAIARWPRKSNHSIQIHGVHELVREMAKSGVHDHLVAPEDLAQARVFARKGWQGILAAMLLVPAWQWPDAPLLMEVPAWLRPDYVRWLFAAPVQFSVPGQVEAFSDFQLGRLEELARWLNRGPAGEEVTKVLGAYASHCALNKATCSQGDLRRHAELRGRLLRRAMGHPGDAYTVSPLPRTGRRLRIGIIDRSFESRPETYATLPLFEHHDQEKFEVLLFTYVNNFSEMEDYCRSRVADMIVLPGTLAGQLELLRNMQLDVAVFTPDLTAECNVVTRLALHRVAPLQVVTQATGISSGLPEIDLHLSGTLSATEACASQFAERLALMPGPSHTFNHEVDRTEPQVGCTRADFGLPQDAFVFVSTADFRKIIPEVQAEWARVLAAVPGAYLLVHPFAAQEPTGHTVQYFYTGFEKVLKNAGVDSSRLVVSTVPFASRSEVRELVRLGDACLDTFPLSSVDALVDPLSLGLPVVGWAGQMLRSRTGGSLLRSLGLDELIAGSADDYQAIARKLATDSVFREDCRARLKAGLATGPAYLDTRKTSDGFGALMEKAYDEVVACDPAIFRAQPSVVVQD